MFLCKVKANEQKNMRTKTYNKDTGRVSLLARSINYDLSYKNVNTLFTTQFSLLFSVPDSAACSYDGKPRYLKAPTGVIASEGFPNSYSNNIECGFAIWVSGGDLRGVTLTFESFHLEPSHNCSSDYVEVFDGMGDHSRSLGRFCGNEIPSPVSTTEKGFLHHMYVKFISNSRGRYPGFKASYKATGKYWDVSTGV